MPLWQDRPDAWHEILPGVRRRVVAGREGVMMVLYRIQPGSVFPRHTHPHVQGGTVIEGGGAFRVGEETWNLVPGSTYLIPSNVPHELKSDPTKLTLIVDLFVPERDDFRSEVLSPDRP
jgi:quercetin dioxygenase-like cupin family protein